MKHVIDILFYIVFSESILDGDDDDCFEMEAEVYGNRTKVFSSISANDVKR